MLGDKNEAVFEDLDNPGKMKTFKYDLLHIAPPMQAHEFLAKSALADANGFVDVIKETLQHKKFPNVFAIGDCTNLPTSKTAAAIAGSNAILVGNLENLMKGKSTNVPKVKRNEVRNVVRFVLISFSVRRLHKLSVAHWFR